MQSRSTLMGLRSKMVVVVLIKFPSKIQFTAGSSFAEGYEDKDLLILSESQAALKAIKKKINSRIVFDCIKILRLLGRRNRIRLVWLPGHAGIAGNEIPDKVPNNGALKEFCHQFSHQ